MEDSVSVTLYGWMYLQSKRGALMLKFFPVVLKGSPHTSASRWGALIYSYCIFITLASFTSLLLFVTCTLLRLFSSTNHHLLSHKEYMLGQ